MTNGIALSQKARDFKIWESKKPKTLALLLRALVGAVFVDSGANLGLTADKVVIPLLMYSFSNKKAKIQVNDENTLPIFAKIANH
jgi:dsRNA-specific ribonuclease